MKIFLREIIDNPHQTRKISEDEELRELAESIREHGLLQPVKVRSSDQSYELIYGHRRVAAMRLLGWTACEAILENVSDEDSLVQSIAENIQRQNLDILEEARSYKILLDKGYTIKQIAELVNKPDGRISNRLSILRLPIEVQELVRHRKGQHTPTTELGGLSPDSASRIASAISQPSEAIKVARKAIDEGLNSKDVRDLTTLLKSEENPTHRASIFEKPWIKIKENKLKSASSTDFVGASLTGTEPLTTLYHNKMMWNISRINLDNFDHFTIGYASRTTEQFIELLKSAGVGMLIDVRHTPISRFKPNFSKANLSATLLNYGIKYIHLPGLGIPPETRRLVQKLDIFRWYEENVPIYQELNVIQSDLVSDRVAFMCVEVDPQSCHRQCIFKYLERKGYRLYDL